MSISVIKERWYASIKVCNTRLWLFLVWGRGEWVVRKAFAKKAYIRRPRINKVKVRQKWTSGEEDNLCEGHVSVGSIVFSRSQKKSHGSWSQTSMGSVQWREHVEMNGGPAHPALAELCEFYPKGSGKTLKGLIRAVTWSNLHFGKKTLGLVLGRLWNQLGDHCRKQSSRQEMWGRVLSWETFSRLFNIVFKNSVLKSETMIYTLEK